MQNNIPSGQGPIAKFSKIRQPVGFNCYPIHLYRKVSLSCTANLSPNKGKDNGGKELRPPSGVVESRFFEKSSLVEDAGVKPAFLVT